MLMSLSKRYVFLAQRGASSNFEAVYGDSCEVASGNDLSVGRHPVTGGNGKYIGYRTFLEVYDRFFEKFLPIDHFFVFGIMREPMKRLLLLHRKFTEPGEKEAKRSSDIGDFAQFVDHIVDRRPISGREIAPSQYSFFVDSDDRISVNYLIRMEGMRKSLALMRRYRGWTSRK